MTSGCNSVGRDLSQPGAIGVFTESTAHKEPAHGVDMCKATRRSETLPKCEVDLGVTRWANEAGLHTFELTH